MYTEYELGICEVCSDKYNKIQLAKWEEEHPDLADGLNWRAMCDAGYYKWPAPEHCQVATTIVDVESISLCKEHFLEWTAEVLKEFDK